MAGCGGPDKCGTAEDGEEDEEKKKKRKEKEEEEKRKEEEAMKLMQGTDTNPIAIPEADDADEEAEEMLQRLDEVGGRSCSLQIAPGSVPPEKPRECSCQVEAQCPELLACMSKCGGGE